MKQQFYRCPVCGNIIEKMFDSGVTPECCGQPMEVLQPNITDGKHEYHVPVAEVVSDNKLKVKIGKEPHPMTNEHHIQFITVETCDSNKRHGNMTAWLKPGDKPEHTFCVCPKEVVSVFAYCNLHGLWKLDCTKEVPECKNGKESKEESDCKDAETCATYPAYCGKCPTDPQDMYYSCD